MASHQIAGGFPVAEDLKPPYFDGKHYRHWKARMRTYVQSVDYQVWLVIQDGPLPVPGDYDGKKHEGEASATKPKTVKYTREQIDVIQTNARAKHILTCALSMEEFEHISSCETAKEIWDKLEIIHEGTKKIKEAWMYLLVHEYDTFLMKEDETIKDMFRRINRILGDLKAVGRSYSNSEQVSKILRILPRVWQTYIDVIGHESRVQMSYDELRNKLIIYEKTYLQNDGREKKKLNVAFNTILDEENQEDWAMISEGMDNIMRRRRQSKKYQSDQNSRRNNGRWNNKGPA